MSTAPFLWFYQIEHAQLGELRKFISGETWSADKKHASSATLILIGPKDGAYSSPGFFREKGLSPVAFVPDFAAQKQALKAGYVHCLSPDEIQDADYAALFLNQVQQKDSPPSWDSPSFKSELIDQLGIATLATDSEGTVRFWNREAEKLLGHSAEDVLGKTLHSLGTFAPSQSEQGGSPQQSENEFSLQHLSSGEHLIQGKEGSPFPVSVRKSTLYTAEGKPRGYLATLQKMEGSTEEGKQNRYWKYHHEPTRESNQEALLITDAKGSIQYASETVHAYTGYSQQELSRLNAFKLVHPNDRKVLQSRLKDLLSGHRSIQSKHRAYFRNDEYRWVQAYFVDERGTPGIDGIVSTYRDVHKEEQALVQLREVNERFRYASLATQDVIWEYRIAEDELIWGDNFDLIFGLGQEHPLSLNEWEARIHPASRKRVAQTFENLLRGHHETWEEEYRFLKSDGEYSVVVDRGYVLFDEDHRPHRIVGAMQDVTRQRHYQRQLAKSEEKFRKLFEKSLLGVTMTDLKTGRWLDANQALVNMLGYPFEELTQLTSQDITPEIYRETDRENRELMQDTGTYGPYQKELIRKDQQRINVVLSGFSATLPSGREVAWHHILDLSPIEKSNQALQKVQLRFQHYVENASDVFLIQNEDGYHEYVSPNFKSLLGYSAEEVINHHNLNFIHPEDQAMVDEVFQEALKDIGSSHRSHFRGLHKEGHPVWVEANGRFIYDPDGHLQAHLLVRKMPMSREQREQERLLALVADKTTNAVIITDAEQRIHWVNQSFTQFSGYSLEEARGYTPTELLHREKTAEEQQAIQEKLHQGKPFYQESVNYHKDGSPYWIESYVTPIYDSEGMLSHYIAVENNITERRENWQQLEKALEKSRLQSERLENFAHIISHNFRSYCANIMGLAEELPHHSEGTSRREMEANLSHTAQQLMDALQKLGEILHLPEGNQLSMEPLNLRKAVAEVTQQFSYEAERLDAKITVDIPADVNLQASPAYLESILHNLISNALRYRHPDRVPHIDIQGQPHDKEFLLMVSDNGLGIDLEKYGNKLFQMRQSFHHHPESKGLGLYLAQGQMKSMGGNISVKSEVDQGSTFILHFPETLFSDKV